MSTVTANYVLAVFWLFHSLASTIWIDTYVKMTVSLTRRPSFYAVAWAVLYCVMVIVTLYYNFAWFQEDARAAGAFLLIETAVAVPMMVIGWRRGKKAGERLGNQMIWDGMNKLRLQQIQRQYPE